jgi:manganese-dependent inorganic pyrophosphatase
MFEETSDLTDVPAEQVVLRDAKHYEVGNGQTICIAQIETVGTALRERHAELLQTMHRIREDRGYLSFALMITDILSTSTALLVSGEEQRVERALGDRDVDGVVDLPGVMSRKKQLAPRLLEVF